MPVNFPNHHLLRTLNCEVKCVEKMAVGKVGLPLNKTLDQIKCAEQVSLWLRLLTIKFYFLSLMCIRCLNSIFTLIVLVVSHHRNLISTDELVQEEKRSKSRRKYLESLKISGQ